MKKPIIFSVFFFILTAISSFGQGVWIEEEFGDSEFIGGDFRTGKFEINGKVYEIKPNANLEGVNFDGANLAGVNLNGANLRDASLIGANLVGATLALLFHAPPGRQDQVRQAHLALLRLQRRRRRRPDSWW